MSQRSLSPSEFSVENSYTYNTKGPVKWMLSHFLRYPFWAIIFLLAGTGTVVLNSMIPGFTGNAFDEVLGTSGDPTQALLRIAGILLFIVIGRGLFDIVARYAIELLAKRLERDSREELFTSLLGKSQTFHNRQKVGDLMARSSNDMRQLSLSISPGIDLIVDTMLALFIPFIFIGLIDTRLLLAPSIFVVFFFIALWDYMRRLNPVSQNMRQQFGVLNAGLNESVRGVEVIKATGQELQERRNFSRNTRLYRDHFVAQGLVQARYLPTLLLAITTASAVLHGIFLVQAEELSIGQLVAYIGLLQQLSFPTFMSVFTFSLLQMGIVSARRILTIINEKTELDQNVGGHVAPMQGKVVFDNVSFGYEDKPMLRDLNVSIEPGQTVAIVGATGSGKTTMTKLVNRIFDVSEGRVLIDDIDVREWDLDSIRSQVSTIEQDITLFSRSVAENISFGLGVDTNREAIVNAAKDAQAHEFILEMEKGYDTVIGERGVTLSGGQRQRLAIARALLTSPSILVLDDSTSAIDSATEDDIQKAIRRVLEGRTTLLITARLSQIRWADSVLLLHKGEIVDQGTHEDLLARSPLYQRILAHSESAAAHTPGGATSSPTKREAVGATAHAGTGIDSETTGA